MQTVPEPSLAAAKGSGSSRDRIVWRSLELFTARGYSGVSMSDIARASGVTKAAIYYHFTDKETLFLEAFRIRTERLALELGRMIDSSDELEPVLKRIATFLLDDGLADYRQRQTDLLTVVSPERRGEHLAATRGVSDRMLPRLQAMQRTGQIAPDVDLTIAVPLFFSMIGGQIRRLALYSSTELPPWTNAEIAEVIVRIWLHGTASQAFRRAG